MKFDPGAAYPLEPLLGRILSPFERFLRRTTAGGIVLVGTTVLALFVATAFGAGVLEDMNRTRFAVALAGWALDMTLHQWVNDGLMAFFFLMVGLELKREILVGELSSVKDAALPVCAAIGGMVLPASIYAALNFGTPAAPGWGIPMATDIAFAVGILVLLAWRIPKNLIVFLIALAIADDLGAVLVIALFYTADLNAGALGAAAGILAVLVVLNRGGVRHPLPYALLGLPLWLAIHESGVHATVAGILLAATIPARARHTAETFQEGIERLLRRFRANVGDAASASPLTHEPLGTIAEAMERCATAVQSPLQRLEHQITPWVTFVIIPLFALSNAGLDLSAVSPAALADSLTLGVIAGLVIGKFAGIALFSWVAVRLGIARLSAGVGWKHILGAAWLAGIGFTMSLFIAQLAFPDPALVEQAKLGILAGSALAALIGLVWLYAAGDRQPPALGAEVARL